MFTNVSPKVIWSTFAAIIATGVLAMLGYLQTPDGVLLFAGLPLIAVIGIKAAVTAASVALTGYVVTDPLRTTGEVAEAESAGEADQDELSDGDLTQPEDDDLAQDDAIDDEADYEPQRVLVDDEDTTPQN